MIAKSETIKKKLTIKKLTIKKLDDEILTVMETASFLKISRVNAYNLFNRQDFPCIRIGKSMRVYKSDLILYTKRKLIVHTIDSVN